MKFFRFVDDCRIAEINVPVIPGIMPVINATQIRRMVTMCGASFPVRFQKIIHKYEDNKEALFDAGMSYALSQIIDLLESDIDGIHLYSMNNPQLSNIIKSCSTHSILKAISAIFLYNMPDSLTDFSRNQWIIHRI